MNFKSKKKVSIIIPCYNDEDRISEAIESAINQTYSNKEIVVVDDGSTDRSREIVNSYENVNLLENERNRGANCSRNRGIENSSGYFIKFLDSDDTLSEAALEKQVKQSEEVDDKEIVFGGGEVESEGGTRTISLRGRRMGESKIEHVIDVSLGTPYPLHRRSYLEAVGGFREGIPWWQESDLHIRLALLGVEFQYRETMIVTVRDHDDDGRIKNSNWFAEDPMMKMKLVKAWEEEMREKDVMTDRIEKSLAKKLWNGGRKALRLNRRGVAERYFEYARQMHSDCVEGDSRLYEVLVQSLGPTIAEYVGSLKRKM
ncbi:glycosyltransferase family 2 protein [Salinibacter ruber]|uniref:glycosyltransferase family 2 protein n=1 Tax=Salinibacter ruber TaxID=146919 RepID=UPI002167E087|nr:glycosyltransferase family A protein [Salinibacter ruber]MCS4199743.1 glycosyltransferase involved in cell wall biosynthesis [Salinibacter ruber]